MAHQYTTMVLGWINVVNNVQPYGVQPTIYNIGPSLLCYLGPDKLNIRHLKYICPLGLAFLASMFNTAFNNNRIPHTWKLAIIVPITKPNKDTDNDTSYTPISLLSVSAKTLEKSIFPYITANSPMYCGYKTQHSTVFFFHVIKPHYSICLHIFWHFR